MHAMPGLVPLVFFSTFNNLVMGVFVTLMDPYGLNLFSVGDRGVVLGVTSWPYSPSFSSRSLARACRQLNAIYNGVGSPAAAIRHTRLRQRGECANASTGFRRPRN
jgi:hypothetical protein